MRDTAPKWQGVFAVAALFGLIAAVVAWVIFDYEFAGAVLIGALVALIVAILFWLGWRDANPDMATSRDLAREAGTTSKAAVGAAAATGAAVAGGVASAAGRVGEAASTAAGSASAAVDGAKGMASGASDMAKDAAGNASDAAKSAAGAVGDAASGAMDSAKGAAGAVGDAASGAVDSAKGAAGAVGDAASGALDSAKGAAAGAMDSAKGAVGSVGEAASSAAATAKGADAGAAVSGAASTAADAASGAASTATGAAKTAAVGAAAAGSAAAGKAADTAKAAANVGRKPKTLTGARAGGADDLKRIRGVGPKLESNLNGMGYYHFDQIAAWDQDEVEWVDGNMEGFPGRVSRDRWVPQAKLLASGKNVSVDVLEKIKAGENVDLNDYDGDGVSEGAGEGKRPEALSGPRGGKADDLKQIKGVGPKMEKLCNSLGFYHFDQIASWSTEEVAWVDANLEGFKGRVTRDTWVAQAKILAAGGETEFSKKVDKGGVY